MLKTYQIDSKVGFFEELNVLIIVIASMQLALEWYTAGDPTTNEGDYFVVEAKHLKLQIRFPLYGPVQYAIINSLPNDIELGVEPLGTLSHLGRNRTGGLKAVHNALFSAIFLNYYEKHIDEIKNKFGASDTHWPDSWQMGWVMRNGISHNGCVYFRSPSHPAVVWLGLSISPSDNGTPILGNILNVGDLTILLFEMEEARTGTPLPHV